MALPDGYRRSTPATTPRILSGMADRAKIPPARLVVGQAAEVTGIYVMHWEWTRFEIRRSRWRRPERCQLVPAPGVPASPLEFLGRELPTDWRRHPGLRFEVLAVAMPVEHGHFGHMGTLHWRLRVDEWLDVHQIGG